MAKVTNNEKYKKAVYEIINPVLSYFESDEEKGMGFYNGLSGELFSLFNVGIAFKDERLIDIVSKNLNLLEELVVEGETIDIIGGYAGVILSLIYIYKNTNREDIKEKTKDIISICYKKIKSRFDGEKIVLEDKEFLGFAHGSTGITAALYSYYNFAKDEEALELVKKTVAYERSCYNEEKESLPRAKGIDIYPSSWCHGVSGHLLSRLILKDLGFNDEDINKEIKTFIKGVINRGLNHNFCLCHGDLGNLLVLAKAANILEDNILKEDVVDIF